MGQDRSLELLQSTPRLKPKPVEQLTASVLISLQRVGLAPGSVQREHQLTAKALAQRMLAHEPSSSPTSRACSPDARSASIRSSSAAKRDSSNRAISACANGS